MNCKHLKVRSKNYKKYYYCSFLKKEIAFNNCHNCNDKEYKNFKEIKKITKKARQRELTRFSIIYQDNNKCVNCGHLSTEINEVFNGAYRTLSIKYGCCTYFCHDCHLRFHNDRKFQLKYKIMFQNKLVELYGYEWYIINFKINYIERKKYEEEQ